MESVFCVPSRGKGFERIMPAGTSRYPSRQIWMQQRDCREIWEEDPRSPNPTARTDDMAIA